MVALPVKEVEKGSETTAQVPDVTSSVPLFEVEVQVALKEAISDTDTIFETRLFPCNGSGRVKLNRYSKPVINALPLVEVLFYIIVTNER